MGPAPQRRRIRIAPAADSELRRACCKIHILPQACHCEPVRTLARQSVFHKKGNGFPRKTATHRVSVLLGMTENVCRMLLCSRLFPFSLFFPFLYDILFLKRYIFGVNTSGSNGIKGGVEICIG